MSTTFGRSDKIDMFNLALIGLGEAPMTDAEYTTPTRKATRAIKEVYRIVRNAMLREHDWQFARVITPLVAAPSTVTHPGWDYVYYYPYLDNLPTGNNVPQGSVFLRKVFTDIESEDPAAINYQIFNYVDKTNGIDGKFIATQEDDAYARYTNFGLDDDAGTTYGGVNSLQYDQLFIEALAYKIAATVCKRVTGDKVLAKTLSTQYSERLAKALIKNRNEEKTKDEKTETTYVDARS